MVDTRAYSLQGILTRQMFRLKLCTRNGTSDIDAVQTHGRAPLNRSSLAAVVFEYEAGLRHLALCRVLH